MRARCGVNCYSRLGSAKLLAFRPRSLVWMPPMASQSADTRGSRDQNRSLCTALTPIRGTSGWHSSAGVSRSDVRLCEKSKSWIADSAVPGRKRGDGPVAASISGAVSLFGGVWCCCDWETRDGSGLSPKKRADYPVNRLRRRSRRKFPRGYAVSERTRSPTKIGLVQGTIKSTTGASGTQGTSS